MTGGSGKSIPKGWLGCPQNGKSLIADIFMPLKTPLADKYLSKLPFSDQYLPQEIFRRAERNKVKIGLWIDLTNTNRYYDKEEIESEACQYVKLSCPGHGSCPSKDVTRKFISICQNFLLQHPNECIAVHCTHGFNRTGFLIAAYLVDQLRFDVMNAVKAFAYARPPGIYRGNYIVELFHRYGDVSEVPYPPPLPDWCNRR